MNVVLVLQLINLLCCLKEETVSETLCDTVCGDSGKGPKKYYQLIRRPCHSWSSGFLWL